MSRTSTRAAAAHARCRRPASGARRRHRSPLGPATATRRATTPSSTSTRCWTSAAATPSTPRSTRLEADLRRRQDDAGLLRTSRPTSATTARSRRASTAARAASPRPTRSSRAWVPKILASPGVRRRRPAGGGVRGRTPRRPGGPGARRSRNGALVVSRFATAGATTDTEYRSLRRCCARSRTCSR